MKTLIINEFRKLKREWFLLMLLLLTLIPVLTGSLGLFLNEGQKPLGDLFFFINNQFSLFFPMVVFILIGSLFYQEYKNKTYINWITYGYSKTKLFFSKTIVGIIIAFVLAGLMYLFLVAFFPIIMSMGKITIGSTSFIDITKGFFLEVLLLVPITIGAGAIVINLSRNIVVTSVLGVIYGFVSVFFIGASQGYFIPAAFAYRLCMYFVDQTSYYDNPTMATLTGLTSYLIIFTILFLIGLLLFTRKRKIEN
ncbi:ABC transporter permease [Viridibacillus sp. YIM B01967]|uniref:ABC transporter permease n=1 Tax=Viridibacillus soli TaxID=2798301 RepID=A0ABS1HAP1_9BACL|nr:ABC transporter permease [Viridibacillus soli]MBK3496507.1 ABC transporter permease [Viridibacillus soli]